MRIIIIGAGRVGCGALGLALTQQGHDVVFAARRGAVLDALNRHGYTVALKGAEESRVEVRGVRAVLVPGPDFTRAVAAADQVYTTVRPDNLPAVAPLLAAALLARLEAGATRPLDVFCCENLKNAGSQLERLVFTHVSPGHVRQLQDGVAFNAALSDRIVSSQEMDGAGRLVLTADASGEVLYDTAQLKGSRLGPPFKGVDNFPACIEEKLYLLNCGHAVCAYLGHQCGYDYIHEAMADEAVRRAVLGAMLEAQQALLCKHGRAVHYAASLDKMLASFANAALQDTVARVGRDPLRKLQSEDRLVGPLKLAYRYGLDTTYLARGCAAALSFDRPDDPQAVELGRLLARHGPAHALDTVCKLRPWNPLAALVLRELGRLPAAGR